MSNQDPTNLPYTERRPYVMMHEGRDLFSAWFDQLIDAYNQEFPDPVPANGVHSLGIAKNEIVDRLICADSMQGVHDSVLAPKRQFLYEYTSLGAFGGANLNAHVQDMIRFFVNTPINIAVDTWERTPSLQEEHPVTATVEMLSNPSYQDAIRRIATTGFGVLRTEFGMGSRYNRRELLGAQESDVELIQVSEQDGGRVYSLAEWARDSLHKRIVDQNHRWPDYAGIKRYTAGRIFDLPAPISAGCPVKDVSIGPLCDFLSTQLVLGEPRQPNPELGRATMGDTDTFLDDAWKHFYI